MRVSTAQFYYQNSQRLSEKQSGVNDQMKYISSGKRVLTAKDDAVSYGTLVGYKDELANIEKYQKNIIQAENRNQLQENSFANAELLMQQLKQLFIQANNGTLSDSDLSSLADLGEDIQSQMLDIANAKDETGGYVFAGYQIDKKPFNLQPDNSVTYVGDNGKRELQIAKSILVETNQPGDEAFQQVDNPIGDFSATYVNNNSGISVGRAVVATPSAYDPLTNPPDYKFVFTSATDLTVTDGGGATVFTTAAYVPGQTVAFNGVEVQISGNPLPGDEFDLTPDDSVGIFETIKSAIDWMNVGASPVNSQLHQVDYGEILDQIEAGLNHITTQRTESGVRLKMIETQKNNHLDSELYLSQGQSQIEDLDFAKAIAAFEQSQVALQAAQQTFIQIKGLSLFNYI
ncbi:flagellar hook-associated protein FlgL [Thalassotalea insulae]|uniref:Flagellar hook-associated protein FlgL n=2 Tax=Thalassotalea insulae TaxID=2056778 RepID=A0ABQ6GNZ3_9GAMM|nr:flagellar hook-associated protein FlgL [Thalassotalea insulae]